MSYIIRVDDRLIHGQVIEGWIKPLKISTIVICSDIVYCDEIQKTLFELSVPKHVKLECNNISTTAEKVVKGEYDKKNVLILISSLVDLSAFVESVKSFSTEFTLPSINIGGLRHCGDKKQIYEALCLDNKDLELLKKLVSNGVQLEYYLLPEEQKIILNDKISEIETLLNTKEEKK